MSMVQRAIRHIEVLLLAGTVVCFTACDTEEDECDGGACADAGGGGAGGAGGEGGAAGEGGSAGEGGGGVDPGCPEACDTLATCSDVHGDCPGGDPEVVRSACLGYCDEDFAADINGADGCDAQLALAIENVDDIAAACEDVEPEPGEGEACSSDEGDGFCINTDRPRSCEDGGGFLVTGACPGGNNIVCCVEYACETEDAEGTCQSTDTCDGDSTPGLCPGGADIQCCSP
jgi:hypothetical protein